MPKAACPSCLSIVTLNDRPEIGQPVLCPDCQANLTIIWLYPATLGLSIPKDNNQVVASYEGRSALDNL